MTVSDAGTRSPRREAGRLSAREARHLLGVYHFAPRRLEAAFEHLGTVQYDPLNPVGRNPDLVLQARVPGYRVDAWQRHAYRRRRVYDAWDKQVCLTPVEDWPYRRLYHRYFRRRWGERVLDAYPAEVRRTLAELERRGPLSSLDFADDLFDDHRPEAIRGSWYGDKLVKHILRGLWMAGEIVTHHRVKGRHVYDLPERVLPEAVLATPDPGEEASVRYLLERRVRSAGLLRPTAGAALWSVPVDAPLRKRVLADLVAEGRLRSLEVEGEAYLAPPDAPAALEGTIPRGMRFVAPLDGLLWDRRGVERIYGFDYVWEVYKPERERRWGYYVLPVWHRGRFVGRVDSRLERGDGQAAWRVLRFYWEQPPNARTLDALQRAAGRFARYLGADRVVVAEGVDARTGAAVRKGLEA